MNYNVVKRSLILTAALLGGAPTYFTQAQGYIEMPDTIEVPAFEEESMQLDLDVPPVRDRDPDPLGGPRINVMEFRLQGVVEYPKLGITREALIERVESIRFGLMAEDELGKWGYTEKEVSEIADLMADIEKEADEAHVGPVEVQRLVFLIREQRRKRGVTLGMIENVADIITQFYREKGFILAKAFIPEQKVRDGVVTLTLLLGELGEVQAPDIQRVSPGLVQRAFKPYMDEPVTSARLEEALYLVNDTPGLSARGVLSPGRQVGDTLLRIHSTKERWFSGNIRVDNFGSESTSENRFYSDLYIHNPSGLGDEIYLGVLQSFDPETSTYGAFQYNSFWGLPRFRTSLGVSTNDFVSSNTSIFDSDVPLFVGESKVGFASASWIFKRSRVKNISAEIKYTNIVTELEIQSADNDGDVDKLSLSFSFDVLNQKRRHLYMGKIGIHQEDSLSVFYQEPLIRSNTFFTSDLTALMFVNFPFTDYKTRLVSNFSLQYAGNSLSNLVQMNLSGNNRTRAFGVNGLQADDGVYLGVDWIFGLPSGKISVFGQQLHTVVQPYIFFDAAYGVIHPINEYQEEESGRLADVGFGLKLNYGKFNANIFAANALEDTVKGDEDITPLKSFNVEMSYSF